MKYIAAILLILTTWSCEENFSPFTDYKESYVLNCILRSDTTLQVATLFRSYPPSVYEQSSGAEDPAITGADIRVWLGDSVYVFKDSMTTRSDTSRYNTPFHFYYNNNFVVSPNRNIEIEALLINGRRLKAASRTPGEILFRNESASVISPQVNNLIQIFWLPLVEGTFFSPRFEIRYKQMVNGEAVEKSKRVPVRYKLTDGEFEPVFPNPDPSAAIVYQLDAITRALNEISEGDNNKENYYICEYPLFKVIAFDQPSSRYVSSTSESIDDFTVTVNVADYSNIEGGFGLFGSYSSKEYTRLKFLEDYIESFGYNFIREN